MRDLASLFSALADPTRLEMLALLLGHGELCVCDFMEVLGITQSKASRHLRYLWNARLLDDRRAGLWVYYRLAQPLGPEREILLQALEKMLSPSAVQELDSKLSSWLSRKNGPAACCSSSNQTAPLQIKTRKPRPAAEEPK